MATDAESPVERIHCRSCEGFRPHTVGGEPGRRTWTCLVCGTVERRNPRRPEEERALMKRLGIKADRREPPSLRPW
jgi:hypothetical protein